MFKLEKKVTLYPSYFDLNDKIKLQSVLVLFQDIACLHGEQMGVGFEAMVEKGLFWIVTRIKFDILKQPKPYQEVTCQTWPHKPGRVDFDRDYLILDENGDVLIKGTSKWCVISMESRKLVFPGAELYPVGEYPAEATYSEKLTRTPSISRGNAPDYEHIVSYHEIDHNLHLNNVNYANYVFNAVRRSDVSFMQINFISECVLKDKVEVFKSDTDNGTVVCGYVGNELKFSALVR